MREEQTRSTQSHDGHLRRKDAIPARQFSRALDCGGDGASSRRDGQPAWPAARAAGTPREGSAELDDPAPAA